MPRSSLRLRLRKWDAMKGCWSQGVPPSATFPCSSALHKSSNQMFPCKQLPWGEHVAEPDHKGAPVPAFIQVRSTSLLHRRGSLRSESDQDVSCSGHRWTRTPDGKAGKERKKDRKVGKHQPVFLYLKGRGPVHSTIRDKARHWKTPPWKP